jgi:transcriptional regulator with XRE-family HTH domain
VSRIGERVRELRVAAGLSQQALSNAAGLSTSVVSQLEQGTNLDPRLSTLLALADAMGVTLDELAGRTPPVEAPADRPAAETPPKRRKGKKGEGERPRC